MNEKVWHILQVVLFSGGLILLEGGRLYFLSNPMMYFTNLKYLIVGTIAFMFYGVFMVHIHVDMKEFRNSPTKET